MLVSIDAALFVLVPSLSGAEQDAISRVVQGMGKEATALLSTVLALLVFSVMPWVVGLFERGQR